MQIPPQLFVGFLVIGLLVGTSTRGRCEDPPAQKVDWEARYEALIKQRPDIRRKVETGGATKEQVIEWMKKRGGQAKGQGKQYYGATLKLADPADFKKTQQEEIYSGPQPGESLPPLAVVGLTGEQRGKKFDPVKRAGEKPLVLIFQDDSVVGQKGLLICGKFLRRIAEKAPTGLVITSVFLVDDPSPKSIFQYDFVKNIDPVIQMAVSKDGRDGPGAYGLDRNVAMTVIIAKEGKVLHNFALPQPMLYPDPHVFGGIADAIGVSRDGVLKWFANEAQ